MLCWLRQALLLSGSLHVSRKRDVKTYLNSRLLPLRTAYIACVIYRYVIVEWDSISIEVLKGFKKKVTSIVSTTDRNFSANSALSSSSHIKNKTDVLENRMCTIRVLFLRFKSYKTINNLLLKIDCQKPHFYSRHTIDSYLLLNFIIAKMCFSVHYGYNC